MRCADTVAQTQTVAIRTKYQRTARRLIHLRPYPLIHTACKTTKKKLLGRTNCTFPQATVLLGISGQGQLARGVWLVTIHHCQPRHEESMCADVKLPFLDNEGKVRNFATVLLVGSICYPSVERSFSISSVKRGILQRFSHDFDTESFGGVFCQSSF